MATCQNLEVDRGCSKDYVLTFVDSSGSAIDITDYTIYMTVKQNFDTDSTDANAVISKTITNHTSPTTGVSTITLSNSDTELSVGNYFYDIAYKNTDGDKILIQEGKFKVSYSVTNRGS
jgi:hypothetical protein